MGTVWLAHDELLHREVAVKEVRLPPALDRAARAEACRRTVREAMAAAQLRDAGIIKVHDVLTEGERPWIVMELLRGSNLEDAVRDGGPWSPEHTAALGLRLLAALSVAHQQGIQHRDVKPANVFLTEDGRTVLGDFGIARIDDQATMTESGLLIGSPGFIAPERLRGERGGPESDLWSLAATLYATVEGAPPYLGGSPMMVLREVLTSPPRPPQRAGHLGPVLLRMLGGEPATRPPAGETARLLRLVADGREAVAAPAPPRRGNRTRMLVAAGLCTLLAGGAAVAVALRADREPGPRPTPVAQQSGPASDPVGQQTSPAPQPSPTPEAEETAMFTVPVDFCTLLTAGQVRELVPEVRAVGGKRQEEGCEWTSRGVGIGAVPLKIDSEAWDAVPDAAREAFINRKNGIVATEGMVWSWPGIGLRSKVAAAGTAAEITEGVGDEAIVYDLLSRKTRKVENSIVIFRLDNLLVQVDYVNVNKIGDDAAIRAGANKAARRIAAALKETP
ncbi:protein kinase [Streptosporangium sp. KLBMP 9127]|nr:protein kinase [Streptosporangium sp. KLBMP 9127]